jgi:hypothetical protein
MEVPGRQRDHARVHGWWIRHHVAAPQFVRIPTTEITITCARLSKLAPGTPAIEDARMFDWNYWLEIFTTRASQLTMRRPGRDDWISDEECSLIAGSIATFQLGEQSEGRTLLRFSEKFAARHGVPALPAVTALFIKEEQSHAAQLKEFMLANGIPLKKKSWTDSIFRVLRKLAGFEAAVTVLVTAEMIGFVYYRALARATESRCLKAICRAMCADESVHLRYETQLLMTLRGGRGPLMRRIVERAHRVLLTASALIVYFDHRRVLKHVGYDPQTFVRDCRAVYRMVMHNRMYRPRARDTASGPASRECGLAANDM